VVFDGAPPPGWRPRSATGVRVTYAAERTADGVLKWIAQDTALA
jgi:hypothetical protein